MSEENENLSFWESSVTIPFLKDTGYLGAATNGAMPQKAFGLWIESEIAQSAAEDIKGVPYENVWVRIVVDEAEVQKRHNGEYLMYGDFESVEKVLSAMLTASLHQTEVKPQGRFDAYMNQAQREFDEVNTTEECIDSLEVRVAPGKTGGVDLSFKESQRKGGQVVARLNADLSPESWSLLATEFRRLRTWREDSLRKIETARREREKEAAPATPGM